MHVWHLAIVRVVYSFVAYTDHGCGAVYDLAIVLYINHFVYLQSSESLQPVA